MRQGERVATPQVSPRAAAQRRRAARLYDRSMRGYCHYASRQKLTPSAYFAPFPSIGRLTPPPLGFGFRVELLLHMPRHGNTKAKAEKRYTAFKFKRVSRCDDADDAIGR